MQSQIEPNETDFMTPYTDADAPQSETRAEFHISDEASANWYLRRLANLESEKQRVQSQCAAIVKQLESDADGLRYIYEGELQEWTRQELAKKGNRRKSLTLLQGTACFRTVPAGLKITDASAALVHVIAIGADAIKRSIALDTEKYRALAETALKSGEVLPGTETTPERESFTVKFS